jgi:uncharacterized membrane protein
VWDRGRIPRFAAHAGCTVPPGVQRTRSTQRWGASVQQEETGTVVTGVERTITLTDAVVAIAMTLLVLPLVDLAPEAERTGVGSLFSTHGGDFFSFVLSFLVIYQFWAAHERAFAGLPHASAPIRALNMLWLLGIAFLPFPTAVVGRHATSPSAFLYLVTMFALSVLTSAITQLTVREVDEQEPMNGARRHLAFMWLTTAVFGACAVISAWNADLGLWGLLLLLLLRMADRAAARLGGR